MKIYVFSDSHGNTLKMIEVLRTNIDEIDYIIHLGDHCTDTRYIESITGLIPIITVTGNNDHYMARNEYPEEKILDICGKKIFITHGHRQGVKQGYEVISSVARSKKCDIALFGHTHTAYFASEDGIILLNPGSIGYPSPKGYTYGIITIENDKTDIKICEV